MSFTHHDVNILTALLGRFMGVLVYDRNTTNRIDIISILAIIKISRSKGDWGKAYKEIDICANGCNSVVYPYELIHYTKYKNMFNILDCKGAVI